MIFFESCDKFKKKRRKADHMIEFVVPGEPQGKARPRIVTRNGYTHAYTPKGTVAYEELVKSCYVAAAKGRTFGDREVCLEIVANFGIPKSASKAKRESMLSGEVRPAKKPDVDNIVKVVADALNGIAYNDDKQIIECCCSKKYSEEPCVLVRIEGVSNGREDED